MSPGSRHHLIPEPCSVIGVQVASVASVQMLHGFHGAALGLLVGTPHSGKYTRHSLMDFTQTRVCF